MAQKGLEPLEPLQVLSRNMLPEEMADMMRFVEMERRSLALCLWYLLLQLGWVLGRHSK